MARKSPSRLDMRKQVEAAEAVEKTAEKEKKPRKAAAPRTRKAKEKAEVRKRLIWVVYSGSMKEEGRFPYHERAAAEERIEQLKLKSKKMYFIQPVKEIIGEDGVAVPVAPASMDLDDEPVRPKKKVAKKDDDDDDEPAGIDDDDDDDDE
jgi:hypothetical protein